MCCLAYLTLSLPRLMVSALANGVMIRVAQAERLAVFSKVYPMLSLPWLTVITLMDSYGRVRGLQQKPGLPARSHLWWLLAGIPDSRQGESKGQGEGEANV